MQTESKSAHGVSPARTGKEQELRALMRSFGSVLVAYSGGVDSSYLAWVANDELGEAAEAVTGLSPSVSGHQRQQAESFARRHGLRWRTVETREIESEKYRANAGDRCFFCKDELYGVLAEIVGNAEAVVLDGTNADDLGDHRPGRKAAEMRNVRSPLAELGFSKAEIREMSRHHGLETAELPASPCLASRIAPGTPVSIGRLTAVEKGEEIIRRHGFREFRLRVHGDLARIEVAKDEFGHLLQAKLLDQLAGELRPLGFKFVTLDLEGFRSGSMNPADE
ncbi:MAG TPA: ATP-dependent sacrificial sulfur transferase LarE [Pyrinomonadaceae bacterium]|nr:ATP-dependent sacrificial sulfur transferase LarE [Pyrinomonadaceae bacterium]